MDDFAAKVDARIGKVDHPDAFACLLVIGEGPERRFGAVIAPDAPEELADPFVPYAQSRFQRFVEHGPEPDGWIHETTDGVATWVLFLTHSDDTDLANDLADLPQWPNDEPPP
jgi:hypothetical protein